MNNNKIDNNDNKRAVSSCAVCLDLFSPTAPHRPKILLCGHTTCESCIYQWAYRNNPPLLQCPHCRRQFDGLKSVEDDVPVNYALLDMMAATNYEQLPSSKGDFVAKCQISPWCNQPASHRCLQCVDGKQLMCDEHLRQHGSYGVSHCPILHPSFVASYPSLAKYSPPPTCPDHIGLPLTIHCWDCTMPVCDRCALFAHKTHSYTEIHQAQENIMIDLEAQVRSIRVVVGEWLNINNDLIESISWLRSEEEEMLKLTDRMCDEMRDAVEMARESMKKQVVDETRQRCGELSLMIEHAGKRVEEGTKIIQTSQQMLMKKIQEKQQELGTNFVHDGAEMIRSAKQYLHPHGEFHLGVKNIITKIEQERYATTRIDPEKLNEAKMMMEESMRKVIGRCQRGHAESEHIPAAKETSGSQEKKETVPKSLMESRFVSTELPSKIQCDFKVWEIAWSPDCNTIYATARDSPGIREIDAKSGKVIRVMFQGRKCDSCSIMLSQSGHLYVFDWDTLFVISLMMGTRKIELRKGCKDDEFKYPCAICVAEEWDEFYVCDCVNSRIQVFSTKNGVVVRQFRTDGKAHGPKHLTGIAVDVSASLIFVSDCDNGRIRVFTRYGAHVRTFGRPGGFNGQLNDPSGIAVDPVTKHIIVCDLGNNRLCCFDYNGSFKSSITCPNMKAPFCITMNSDRDVAVACHDKRAIFFFQNLL